MKLNKLFTGLMLSLSFVCQVCIAEVSVSHNDQSETNDGKTKGTKRMRVTLKDGQKIIGRVKCEKRCSITSAGGLRIQVDRSSISRIDPLSPREQAGFSDANRTRYLYSPSAFALRQGEGYLSQKQLFFTSVAYGLTDEFTILGGAAIPLWAAVGGFNIILGGKYAIKLNERWRLAVGAETFNIPAQSVGLIQSFFGVTYGSEDGHLTLNIGKPFAYSGQGDDFFEDPRVFMFSLSGNKKLSQSVRLVTENWLVFPISRPSANLRLHSLALRLQGESLAVDLGLIYFGFDDELAEIPLPWLDFAYNF